MANQDKDLDKENARKNEGQQGSAAGRRRREGAAGGSEQPGEAGESIWHTAEVERAFVEDPLFRFLQHRWKPIVILAGVVLIGIWVSQEMSRSAVQNQRRSAGSFFRLREGYDAYASAVEKARMTPVATPAPAETSAPAPGETPAAEATPAAQATPEFVEQRSKVEELLKAQADQGAPYDVLTDLYRDLIDTSDPEGKGPAGGVKVDDLLKSGGTEIADKFFSEFRAFVVARHLASSEGTRDEGLKALETIAERGEVLATAAAWTLAQLAVSEEERSRALAAVQGVRNRLPEQAPHLESVEKQLEGQLG